MRIRTLVVLVAAVVVAQPLAAVAAPSTDPTPVRPAPLVDRDGDRVSDGLQAAIDDAAPGDRFDVVVTASTPRPAAFARARVGAFALHREFRIIDGFHATMTARQIRALARSPQVDRIEENFIVHTTLDASRSDFGTDAARVDYGVDGTGIGVCVVDTGADPNHEQLNDGKIAGFVDYVNDRTEPYDDHGHGTHVTSTAVGDGTGSSLAQRFQGVAPKASAYIAKVLSSGGSGTEADIVAGIDWCATQAGVHVINMSLGTTSSSDGKDAISTAANRAVLNHGKIVVAAAGNSGDYIQTVGSPAAAAEAITVGSVAKYSAPEGYHTNGIYLSEFSSRGPTADGRVKPDIVAPGERTVAAKAGSTATYVEMTGTSMATPFVAGAVALTLDANPSLSPAQVKSLVMGTADDRGPAGTDNDWGAGLLDGYELVAQAAGGSGATSFPTATHLYDKVRNNGSWTYQFTLGEADLSIPIAATIIIDGSLECVFSSGGWCFQYAYVPDLDAELRDPTGALLDESTCPLGCGFYSVGRQETLDAMPTVAGTYTIRVYPYDGTGGSFWMDLSRGPLTGSSEEPINQAPVATGDSYTTQRDTALSVVAPGVLGNDSDADGDPLTAALATAPTNGSVTLNADGSFTYTPNAGYTGSDSFTYVANDGTADSSPATVAITVEEPPADVVENVHVGDLDGSAQSVKNSWTATVTIGVHDHAETPVASAVVSYEWSDGTSGTCTTDATGRCTATSATMAKRTSSITLTVTGVSGPYPYDGTANHDDDGDSTGTSIVVAKP